MRPPVPLRSPIGAHSPPLGFTLVETLMAVLLGSIMLTALYASFACGFATIKLAREDLRATQIMLKTLESVRLYSWSQITNSTSFPAFTDCYSPKDQADGKGGAIYAVNVTTARPPLSSPASMYALPTLYGTDVRTISVTVYWTNQCGPGMTNTIVHSRNMQTYVAKNGAQSYIANPQ